jgi:hypothetical protein
MEFDSRPYAFIVGSPRSGTTILGELLDSHRRVSQWYEPYFIWDHHFRLAPDDERRASDADERVCAFITGQFSRYRRDHGNPVVVDKSPRNSLKIPFIRAIFPQARFIHIIRDGRDATLSIHREWQKRLSVVTGHTGTDRLQHGAAVKVVLKWLRRQPFWRDRLRALTFELGSGWLDRSRHLNRLRWNGAVGWGPRFAGWTEMMRSNSLLRFNALQWARCTRSVLDCWPDIPDECKLEIHYETMIRQGRETLRTVCDFLGIEWCPDLEYATARLNPDNFGKWKTAFSREQLLALGPLLTPELISTGYVADDNWYRSDAK